MQTLTPFFDWILTASARASLLTVVVLIAHAVLGHRAPARWRHALWLPVLFVLLMPAFPESSWNVISIRHKASVTLPQPSIIQHSAASRTQPAFAPVAETSVPVPWRQIMCLAWLAGAVGMALVGIAAYAQTLWQFRRSRLPVSDALQRELASSAREIGLRRVPCVWMALAIRSPAVTGLLRPILLLPPQFEQTLTPQEARLVLKHELMHLKRGDLPLNALLCLLLALHWFNPLLWLAFFRARLDREAACDAQVLVRENQSQRVAYGHTLLKIETAFGHHGLSLGFVGIFQRGAALRARIHLIASPPNQHPLMKTALSLCIVLLTFLGITKAATPDAKAPHIYIATKFVEITERNPSPSGGAPLPALLDSANKVPGLLGTLPDPQCQVLIRTLSQRKGVDLMSAPSLTTTSGQDATIEVTREFINPDDAGKPVPARKPATMNPGVSLSVIPHLTGEDQLALDLATKVVEFEGFENPKKDAKTGAISKKVLHADGTTTETASDGEKGEVRESTFDARGNLLSRKTVPASEANASARKPIFKERSSKAHVEMTPGQTMILEMEPRTDKQTVEETDESGHVISSKVDLFHRRLFVFVTACLVDPVTGKPVAP